MENKQLTVQEKNITEKVQSRIKELESTGDIKMPANYSYSNALKSAYLNLSEAIDRNKKPVLESCSQTSIMNTLLDMCILGLSPAKKQCYFIPFGGKLQLMTSYLGNVAATKRLKGVQNVYANIIYKGDKFSYSRNLETGLIEIKEHEQNFENLDNEILGAYAVVVRDNDPNYVEIMTMKQIRNSWNQGAAKGQSGAHNNFADQMCKKTVINRACKNFICTSDDSDILIESMNRTNESQYDPEDIIEQTHEEVKKEINQNANQEILDIQVEEIQAEEVKNGAAKQTTFEEQPF